MERARPSSRGRVLGWIVVYRMALIVAVWLGLAWLRSCLVYFLIEWLGPGSEACVEAPGLTLVRQLCFLRCLLLFVSFAFSNAYPCSSALLSQPPTLVRHPLLFKSTPCTSLGLPCLLLLLLLLLSSPLLSFRRTPPASPRRSPWASIRRCSRPDPRSSSCKRRRCIAFGTSCGMART